LPEAAAGALVEGPVADDRRRGAGRHRHRGVKDRAAGRPAAVVHPGEERQVADTGLPGHRDLVVGVLGEGHQAVHVGRRQPGVAERGQHGLGRELKL
jgi:hypothetical protein